jgi:hypothetical protein
MTLNENPNCKRTHASYRLGGDAFDAEQITRRTGIDPDFARWEIGAGLPGLRSRCTLSLHGSSDE